MANTSSSTLTISQASQILGVSEVTLRQWTDEGKIEAFITPGGHRRYTEAELHRFMGTRNRVHGIRDLVARMELAPEQEQQIAQTEFPRMSWYNHLDDASKVHLGTFGKRVHEIVVAYITKPTKRTETARRARDTGIEFGQYLAQTGLSLTDCLEAFMMHRAPLITAATDLMKKRKALNERAAEAIPLVTHITDEVLLALVTSYQSYKGGDREKKS